MEDEFGKGVEEGIKLSKRIYFGKDRSVSPPKRPTMQKSMDCYLPAAPMVYAVIVDPGIVDNPDIPSYQPHVHGRCDPPALIPLQMNDVAVEVDCYLDTAFVRVFGSWRLHCVMGSRSCDCRVAIPMGEQGSILGVEVDVPQKSYSTHLVSMNDKDGIGKVSQREDGGFLKHNIFTLTIPEVDGGSKLSVRVSWSQKLLYSSSQFTLDIPFSFPEHVTPAGLKISKKEKIQLNVNSATGTELLCNSSSHPLKELRREAGKLCYLYESEVLTWSSIDFNFTYTVSTNHIFGGVLLQSPSLDDFDQREIFSLCLFPGNQRNVKVFQQEVVFIVDISGSMKGLPLENTKIALSAALSKLGPTDSFNIIAFNEEAYLFSSSMVLASKEAIENGTNWINVNFIAGGGTNILLPLNKAMELLPNGPSSIPMIFLVTDGAVEDERKICDLMKDNVKDKGSIPPRIYTVGIGSFCNHYFLRMLATITRGLFDAAYDVGSIEPRMRGLLAKALSPVVANITIDGLDDLDDLEVYPSCIPDLLRESPLIVSGRYRGNFPDSPKVRGVFADLGKFVIDLKIQKAHSVPLEKVFASQQINLLTAQAWYSENKQLKEKVVNMSIQTSNISEHTCMALLQTETGKKATGTMGGNEGPKKMNSGKGVDLKGQKVVVLLDLGLGFGNMIATIENLPPGAEEKMSEAAEIFVRAASNCCGRICGRCCCMCCIQCCSRMNDQCVVVLTQLCSALACFGCLSCCDLCSGQDG